MKNIKKVLSLALALVMVVGALVVLPTEVKAAPIATLTTTAATSGETGIYGFKLSTYCEGFELGADYTVSVVLSSDGAQYKFGGGLGVAANNDMPFNEWTGNGATTTLTYDFTNVTEDKGEIQVWWFEAPFTFLNIDSITVTKKTVESDGYTGVHKFTGTGADNAFTINPAQFCEGYADGKDYVITVKMTSDGGWSGMIGGCTTSSYTWIATEELRGDQSATWTFEIPVMYGSPKVELWWIGGTYVSIDEITIVEKVAETPNPENPGDNIESTGDFNMVLPLVLVLFGGVAVMVASKKRFA